MSSNREEVRKTRRLETSRRHRAYFISEVRHVHVSVLQIRDQHQVVIRNHVRNQVVQSHLLQT